MVKRLKRPRDPVSLAKLIGDIATGAISEEETIARESGAKGGRQRAAKLTAEERSRIARQAAAKRWAKN